MEVTGNLMITLQQIINNKLMHSDIDYAIAEYILRNLHQPSLTINTISEGTHISKASVTRFAQSIGYSGFAELKNDIDLITVTRNEMKIDLITKNKGDTSSFKNQTTMLQKEFDIIAHDLARFNETIDFNLIEKISDLIYRAHNVHIFATLIPGNISQALQNMLLTSGKFVTTYPTVQQQYEVTKSLSKDDLILFISLEGSHVMRRELTIQATNSDATCILITQNPEMKLGSLFDKTVPLGEHDLERSGKYKLLMFVEYLAHFYFNKYSL